MLYELPIEAERSMYLFSDCQNRGESNQANTPPTNENLRLSLVFAPVAPNNVTVADVDNDSELEIYKHARSHYILRNIFELSAHSILTIVKTGIATNCNEPIIVRYALDAFREQIEKINRSFRMMGNLDQTENFSKNKTTERPL